MNTMFYKTYFYTNLFSAFIISIFMLIKENIMPDAAVILVTLSSLVGAIVTFFLEYISSSQCPKNKME